MKLFQDGNLFNLLSPNGNHDIQERNNFLVDSIMFTFFVFGLIANNQNTNLGKIKTNPMSSVMRNIDN